MIKHVYLLSTRRKHPARGQEGASAVEYGLILGLVAVAIVLVLGLLGTDLTNLFTTVTNALP